MEQYQPNEIDNSTIESIKLQLSEDIIDVEDEQQLTNLNELLFLVDEKHKELFDNNLPKKIVVNSDRNKLILKNSEIINKLFIDFLRRIPPKTHKFEIIFITFCDYFDFPYNKVYIQLNFKLKTLLETRLRKLIGNSKYNKNHQKYIVGDDQVVIPSVFDILN